jgi:hypothetical protein
MPAVASGVGSEGGGDTRQGQNLLPEAVEIPMASDGPASPSVPAPGPKLATEDRTSRSARSILSLFREYSGPKTVQALTALFSQTSYPRFRQEPPIVLSDGNARMTVYLTPVSSASQSPNFALTGAKLVSLKLKGAEYVLEIIPDVKVFEASVTVLSQGRFTEYPLVVAPPLNLGGPLDEATFTAFLKGHPESKVDLNSDGRSDYLDLYLYTANYLVRQKAAAPAAPAAPRVATPSAPVMPAAAPVAPQAAPAVPVPAAPQVAAPAVPAPIAPPAAPVGMVPVPVPQGGPPAPPVPPLPGAAATTPKP